MLGILLMDQRVRGWQVQDIVHLVRRPVRRHRVGRGDFKGSELHLWRMGSLSSLGYVIYGEI